MEKKDNCEQGWGCQTDDDGARQVAGSEQPVTECDLLVREHHCCSVRRVLEHVVSLVRLALLHRADLLADRDERVAEAVELCHGL